MRNIVTVLAITSALLTILYAHPTYAESNKIPYDIQYALDNLKDDNLQFNCAEAVKYLYERREHICDLLVDSLPTLDDQGRAAVLRILIETSSYEPDEYAVRLMMDDLREGYDCRYWMRDYDFILYLEGYVYKFDGLLATYIKAGNIRQLWAVTHILERSGALEEYKSLYTPEVMDFVILNMQDDDISNNASFAARTCLLLEEFSASYLVKEAEAGDAQSKRVSEVLLDIILYNNEHEGNSIWVKEEYWDVVCLDSYYIDRLEKDGLTELSEFLLWLLKCSPETPRFLTGEQYANREEEFICDE